MLPYWSTYITLLVVMLCLLRTLVSLVAAMSDRTSCTQMHELPQSYRGDNWDNVICTS